MNERLIKFVWGASDRIKGGWHLGLWARYDRRIGLRNTGLAVSVRGLLCWGSASAVVLYLGATLALYGSFRRNPANQITYADTFLLPFRWQHVREVRGLMMIKEGLADLKARRWAQGNSKLRLGLVRAPHDLQARLALAQLYTLANRRSEVVKILTEDLANGYPGRANLQVLFSVEAEGEDFDAIVTTCDRFASSGAPDRRWLMAEKINALNAAGRTTEVLQMPDAVDKETQEVLEEGRVQALLKLNRTTEALKVLDRWQDRPGAEGGVTLPLRARVLRAAGRYAEMEVALEQLRRVAPADPRTYVYGIMNRSLSGQAEPAAASLEEYFRRFAGTAQNLQLIANALAECGAWHLVQRCAEEAAAQGFPTTSLHLLVLQTQLLAGEFERGALTLATVKAQSRQWAPDDLVPIDLLTRLLAVAAHPDDVGQAELLNFFRGRAVSIETYRKTCEVLLKAQRFAVVRQVLELASQAYPASPTLAALRAREELVPKASVVVKVAATEVARFTEERFFGNLATATKAGRWASAAEAISEVRVSKPDWFVARAPEIWEWQMRVAVHTGDAPELLMAARFFLDGRDSQATRLVGIARELADTGNRRDAERLVAEVLRKHPGCEAARDLRSEWRARDEAAGVHG